MKNWRINLIFILIIICGAVIIDRLAYYQIFQHDFYKALAQGQQNVFNIIKGERGDVFFNGGELLATNVKGRYVFICPDEILNKEEIAKELSRILSLDEESLLAKINKDSLFEKIKTDITDEEMEEIKKIDFEGVYLGEALFRNYPQGAMASQVIGFFGGDGNGQYGIEGYYDDVLQGKELIEQKEKNSISSFLSSSLGMGKGADLFLTLDYNIQFIAESLLEKANRELNIEGGEIIVMDPISGRILALANFPNFDPNNYSDTEDFDLFQDGAVQKLFEPGSVFKPITMASAIDQGKITPDTTYVDEGKLKIGEYIIENYNSRVFGEQTMTGVLERSINTGAVFAERRLGHDLFLEYLDSFGFFELTNIDLQGEVFSDNKIFKRGYEINFATASFGQGVNITPIQLVKSFSAIANQGKLVKPYIVEEIIGDEYIKVEPEISSEQIISSKTASQITAMLVSVIENGYAKSGKIAGYYMGGKTGTAQIPWSAIGIDKKGYSDKTWQSFIGFGPAFNPRFLILVKLDNPATGTAEYSAVPIYKELAKYIIDYYHIPPDYE
jgi:cell division protein FtsI/penicillin-binding protein 2